MTQVRANWMSMKAAKKIREQMTSSAGPEQREMGEMRNCASPEKNRKSEKKIDDGRDERQQNLKQENVGQSDRAERAVARAADGVAMFPDGLERAKGPAEALGEVRILDRIGNFRWPMASSS